MSDGNYVLGGVLDDLARGTSPLCRTLIAEVSQVATHPVYAMLANVEAAVQFMELQVWCVWDFMFVAKSVQIGVGCYSVPWVPPRDAAMVAIINEIISSEEADLGPDGTYQSHFEIYIAAMRQAGADIGAIERTLTRVADGKPVLAAMKESGAPEAALRFVAETLSFCSGPLHVAAAALCIGREELVPRMFETLLSSDISRDPKLTGFMWYVRRHVNLDTDSHGPLSARLFRRIVGHDSVRLHEAITAGLHAVRARKQFLDAAQSAIASRSRRS